MKPGSYTPKVPIFNNRGPDTWCRVEMRAIVASKIRDCTRPDTETIVEFQVRTQEPWLKFKPEIHTVVAYGKYAVHATYAREGDILRIEGRLVHERVQDSKSDVIYTKSKIHAEVLYILHGQGNYVSEIEHFVKKHTKT